MIGDVSVGTGFSGIFATGTLLFAKWMRVPNQTLFFIETPSMIIFYFAFHWLDKMRRIYPYIKEHSVHSVHKKSSIQHEELFES